MGAMGQAWLWKCGIRLNKSLQIEKFAAFHPAIFFISVSSPYQHTSNLKVFYFPNPTCPRNSSVHLTFWQLCINKHGLRPPPFSLFVNTPRSPFCHRTPVRDCLRVAEPCLGLGPKPDNLTVIHSKLIKHLQRCHDGEGALFISVLHHQHAGRPRYARGVSIYLCKWDSSVRGERGTDNQTCVQKL